MNAHSLDFTLDETVVPLPKPRKPVSAETRAKMSEAAKRRLRTPETAAKIGEGLRQFYGEPDSRQKGLFRVLTAGEAADFRTLRNAGRYSVREALVMVGRCDLLHYRPTPLPPRQIYRLLSSEERVALWGVWHEAESWQHGLELIKRADLI